jgi:hypothetical protein
VVTEKERYISQLRKAIHDTSNVAEQEKSSLKKVGAQAVEERPAGQHPACQPSCTPGAGGSAAHSPAPPQEQLELQEALHDKDANLKDELVRQARHQKAFGEIRRLIDWATTPPSSMRSSMCAPRQHLAPPPPAWLRWARPALPAWIAMTGQPRRRCQQAQRLAPWRSLTTATNTSAPPPPAPHPRPRPRPPAGAPAWRARCPAAAT